jgi:hypothetical protein
MYSPTEKHKNLTRLEVIELLGMLRSDTEIEIAEHFGVTHQTVSYYRRKYNADTPQIIDKVIAQLEKGEEDTVNHDKRAACHHHHLVLKCSDCGQVHSEKDADKIIEMATPNLRGKLTEQTI